MKNEIEELRDTLTEVFYEANERERSRVEERIGLAAGEMDAPSRAALDRVLSAMEIFITGLIGPERQVRPFRDSVYDDIEAVLNYKSYAVYDGWCVRKDIADESILAAADAIRGGKLEQLEGFRDPESLKRWYMPYTNDYARYLMALQNLQYIAIALAHYAKHLDSFAAAKPYLSAASRIQRIRQRAMPHVKDEQEIFALLEDFRSGDEELRIAIDYEKLGDWEGFCKVTAEQLAAQQADGSEGAAK